MKFDQNFFMQKRCCLPLMNAFPIYEEKPKTIDIDPYISSTLHVSLKLRLCDHIEAAWNASGPEGHVL